MIKNNVAPMRGVERDTSSDIIKGLLMVLVVTGHTEFSFSKWIYLFHVACFFMVSGYFWNDKRSSSFKSVEHYIMKRLKRLYVPFLLANIVALLFHNYFLSIGLYSDNLSFLEITNNYPINQRLSNYREFSETICFVGKSFLLMSGGAKIVSTCWFLSTLIIIELIQTFYRFVVLKLLKRYSMSILFDVALIIISMGMCLLFQLGLVNLPSKVIIALLAYTAYLMGHLVRILENGRFYNFWTFLVSFLCLIILSNYGFIDISKCVFTNPLYYCAGTVCGWFFIKYIAITVNDHLPAIGDMLISIGRHTMAILLLHFVCFKAVSWMYVVITDSSPLLLATHPSIYNTGTSWLWLCYVVLGVFIPISIDILYKKLKNTVMVQFVK